jgi:hypothetical protein
MFAITTPQETPTKTIKIKNMQKFYTKIKKTKEVEKKNTSNIILV